MQREYMVYDIFAALEVSARFPTDLERITANSATADNSDLFGWIRVPRPQSPDFLEKVLPRGASLHGRRRFSELTLSIPEIPH
jgi:hypothetical protein